MSFCKYVTEVLSHIVCIRRRTQVFYGDVPQLQFDLTKRVMSYWQD
uniref:Uncharacterized protein n=1 Tax=Anguilla anguilla TaxID=7936 RepID=A0A0E9UWT4_ANGAN